MTRRVCAPHHNWPTFVYYFGIIIIIINEKINVAFSRRTARTRNSHKKNKSRENVVSNSTDSPFFSVSYSIVYSIAPTYLHVPRKKIVTKMTARRVLSFIL